MKYASDFRRIARDSLRGKWAIAVVAGLIAVLLGNVSWAMPEVEIDIDNLDGLKMTLRQLRVDETWDGVLSGFYWSSIIHVILVTLAACLLALTLGSIIDTGYAQFNLNLVDRWGDPELKTIFRYFPHWKNLVVTGLLVTLHVLLWSLLLVIPGIVAAYSYAMTNYILAEHPELTAREAMARSKEMMEGNRWRLFCLGFSFIGWRLLCGLTMGIGNLWLVPYEHAAVAAFYRDVSGTGIPEEPQTGTVPEYL